MTESPRQTGPSAIAPADVGAETTKVVIISLEPGKAAKGARLEGVPTGAGAYAGDSDRVRRKVKIAPTVAADLNYAAKAYSADFGPKSPVVRWTDLLGVEGGQYFLTYLSGGG